jgi:hypothetical protein
MSDMKTHERLRDRFFTLGPKSPEAEAFRAEVNAVDDAPGARIDGLRVSHFPSRSFKAVRFFDAERLEPTVRAHFARPLTHLPHLAAGFVDPAEFSFRTFENIVSLDGFFDGLPLDEVKLEQRTRFGDKQVYAFALSAGEHVRNRLQQLDTLGLYAPPLNAGSRGGQRFIFHSTQLAESLTRAVKDGLGKSLLGGFSHVNPVFRCNRFEPGDEKFHQHFDTPYFDASRKHVSRYTLLIYLNKGVGSPALEVEGAEVLTRVAPFTCVVLDQQYAHEGRPFDDGRKVFLRTELIFEEPALTHDPAIGEVFARAVYLTGESVFAPELERHAEAAYNVVAEAHWRGLSKTPPPAPLVHKHFRGLHFITNGFDFYFPKAHASVQEASALALLDFFNAEVDGVAFRKACKSSPMEAGANAVEVLAKCAAPAEPVVGVLEKSLLFPPAEESNGACCPFHRQDFIASRHDEIIDLYASAQAFVQKRLMPAPVSLMGDQVMLDPSRFVIDGDKVHVLSKSALAPVNFAACWNFGGSPPNYVRVEATVEALQPLVPPILFGSEGDCWHLRFDFFRNSWMVKLERQSLPIPVIADLDPAEAEEGDPDEGEDLWTSQALDEADPQAKLPKASAWWGSDSPLLRELNSYRALRKA